MSYQCGGETLVPVVKHCVSDSSFFSRQFSRQYQHKLWLCDAALMPSILWEIDISYSDIEGLGSLKRDRQLLSFCGIEYTLYMSL